MVFWNGVSFSARGEMADAADLKSAGGNSVRVRVPPRRPSPASLFRGTNYTPRCSARTLIRFAAWLLVIPALTSIMAVTRRDWEKKPLRSILGTWI